MSASLKMGQLASLILLLISAVVPVQVPLRSPEADGFQVISKDFDKFVDQTRTNGKVPGVSMGVVYPSGEVEFGSWGQKTEDGQAMSPDTLFIIASCSKAVTASAVGILIDDFSHGRNVTVLPSSIKKLDWSTKIVDLLPGDWELMDEWASAKANLQDVLSHVSGLPRHDFAYSPLDTPGDVVRRMRYLRPAFELRQKWSYNNQMYMLATHIITTYSGMPFTEFVKTRIFGPANMTSSTYSVAEASIDGRLTQSWTKSGRRIPIWFEHDGTAINAGPGGVITSIVDTANWLKVLLNSGVHPVSNTTVLPLDTFLTTTTAHAIESGVPLLPGLSISGYGFGWLRVSYKGHEVVHHSGGIPGFSTIVAFLPSDGFAFVLFINAGDKDVEALAILMRAVDEVLGLKKEDHGSNQPDLSLILSHPEEHSSNTKTSLSLDVKQYAGTYADPAYGTITLCSTSSSTAYCKGVLSEFAPFEDAADTNAPVKLYASFKSIWGSHLRLIHQTGDVFAVTLTSLFPDGYGRDTSPFELWEKGSKGPGAKFVVEDAKVVGFGLVGTVGETTERERVGGSVQHTADAWFERV